MGFFIPQTLKKINNWVVWKKEGQGYIKKIPYDPRTGYKADPTKSCCSFESAVTFYKYGGNFDGIGFCFTKDCNMTFIDIDHCINENYEETQLAKKMQKLFSDCYMEYSQSEQGIHIICLGTVPRAIKTKEIEIYSNGRYVALTGNSINANEPQEAQKRLDMIFKEYSVKSPILPQQPISSPLKNETLTNINDINSLIKIIMKSRQGKKWERLHSGDLHGYPSTSEGAQAYISITNYFAGGNDDLIKKVFAKSTFPKINSKYKKDYYIDRMIINAKNTLTYNKPLKITRNNITDLKHTKRKRF